MKPAQPGGFELLGGFHLLRHQAPAVTRPAENRGALQRGTSFHVDLDEVGEWGQRLARIAGHEVIQGDHVSGLLQTAAGGDHRIVGRNRFQDFDHHAVRGQQRDVILEQNFAGAIDERPAPIAHHVESDDNGRIQRAPRGGIAVDGGEIIRHSVAEQQLVAEDALVRGQNGLPGHVARVTEIFGRCRRTGHRRRHFPVLRRTPPRRSPRTPRH